jgi:hypothetical protein
MSARATRITIMVFTALAVAAVCGSPAFASSDFRTGPASTQDPFTGRESDTAVCRLFIGPRDPLQEGEFLLELADINPPADDALHLRGTVVSDVPGGIILDADETAAQEFYEQVMRTKFDRPAADLSLRQLLVTVTKTEGDIGEANITCRVRLTGFIVSSTSRPSRSSRGPVIFAYEGSGLLFPAVPEPTEQPAQVTAGQCPRPNFAPQPNFCGTPDCLVTFAGYRWWTEYDFFSSSGFWNQNNVWSPRNVEVRNNQLHLYVREQDTPNSQGNCCVRQWTAGEAVTALNLDGTDAKLGYGTYLVAARVASAPSWDAMDPNVAFGVFTYERDGKGNRNNPHRELDLAEVSRWGRRGDEQQCRQEHRVEPSKLCEGNAQFTLQLWNANPEEGLPNLHRYTVIGANEITLVMIWPGAQQPVTFKQYSGLHSLDTLPATANHEWITPAARNPWVPADGCQQFHLNLWMGNFIESERRRDSATGPLDPKGGFNPAPATVQEVVVTNFQYRPIR